MARIANNWDLIITTVDDYMAAELNDTEYSVIWSQGSVGNMQQTYNEAVTQRKVQREAREAIGMLDDMLDMFN